MKKQGDRKSEKELTGYELSRQWFAFAWENDMVTANHTALYFFMCQLWNQLGQPAQFKITAVECMRGMSANSYNTYKKSLDFLIENGCLQLIKKSANQFTCNVVALSKFDKAPDKALDRALYGASDKAPDKALDTSRDTFFKPETSNLEPGSGNSIPPHLDDIKKYFSEKTAGAWSATHSDKISSEFFNRYSGTGWMSGKNKIVQWTSIADTWISKNPENASNHNSHATQSTGSAKAGHLKKQIQL